MKNCITINGITYAVRKQQNEFTHTIPDACARCAIRVRCKARGAQPCLLFEDKTHEVYFVKIEE